MLEEWRPRDWKRVTLRDLGYVGRGKSKHRPRDDSILYGGKYPLIQTGDVKESKGRITTYNQTYNEIGLAQSKLWPKYTMCITIAANIAETGILTFPSCFPDSIIGFIADPKKCNVYFIEYIFRFLKRYIQHENVGTGTVQDNINLQTIDRLEFPIPTLSEQNQITNILKILDDQIEFLKKINNCVEKIIRTIFKSWFVDFDGRTELVDSELGPIPKGWKIGELGNIARNIRTQTNPQSIENHKPYIGLEHITRGSITLDNWGINEGLLSNKFSFNEGDILFGKLRPYFKKVIFAPFDGICSTDILVINSKSSNWFSYVLCIVISENFINYTNTASTGTRMPRTDWGTMSKYQIVLPPEEIIKQFNNLTRKPISQIKNNIFEIRALSKIRDSLLPKLMSGEITV